jgi:hypothetical protein
MIKGYHLYITYRGAGGRYCSLEFRCISKTNYNVLYNLCQLFKPKTMKVTEKNLAEWLTSKDRMERIRWWQTALHLCEPSGVGGLSTIKRHKYILDGIKRCVHEIAFKKERVQDELY